MLWSSMPSPEQVQRYQIEGKVAVTSLITTEGVPSGTATLFGGDDPPDRAGILLCHVDELKSA